MHKELVWIDGKHKMRIVIHEGNREPDVQRWDEEKNEWEDRDARDDWTGSMLLDGFANVIIFLGLGKLVK
jgi:G3E family GTPase